MAVAHPRVFSGDISLIWGNWIWLEFRDSITLSVFIKDSSATFDWVPSFILHWDLRLILLFFFISNRVLFTCCVCISFSFFEGRIFLMATTDLTYFLLSGFHFFLTFFSLMDFVLVSLKALPSSELSSSLVLWWIWDASSETRSFIMSSSGLGMLDWVRRFLI